MATQPWAIGLVILATLIGSMGPILLKIGSSKGSSKKGLDILKNYYILGGFGLYGIGTVLFIPALKGGELSFLYPLVALTYIWVSLLSKKILKEQMNKLKWIGIFIIIIGVIFISIGSQ